MPLFVRLLGGVAAIVVAGWAWTSVVLQDRKHLPVELIEVGIHHKSPDCSGNAAIKPTLSDK